MAPRLLDEHELTSKNIRPKSRAQRWRLIRLGRFPKPLKVGGRNFWIEAEIEAWEAERIADALAARDAQAVA